MGDWPQGQDFNRVTIAASSLESIGPMLASMGLNQNAAVTWPAANRAIFVPFLVYQPVVVVKLFTIVGTSSGNIDVGIYDTGANRLVSAGSTAMAGTNTIQIFDVTDTTLNPGSYYFAVALDNNSGSLQAAAPAVAVASAIGVLSQSTAFALPATATFAAAQDACAPAVGLTARTTV